MNPLTAIIFRLRPPELQIEARCCQHGSLRLTEYRFTRIADGVWCQEAVSDVLVEHAISVEALARHVLRNAQDKLAQDPVAA